MRLIDADKVLEFMNNKLEMQELYLPVHHMTQTGL